MSLNPAQQAAVDHRGGPLLVLAGAGTGKTRVLTHRIASLLDDGVPAWRILAVTFTNKAAAEMRERIEGIAGDIHDVSGLWVGTFHSICARILRRWGRPVGLSRNFSIYDSADQLAVMKRAFADLNISTAKDSATITPKAVLGHIDTLKNRGHGIERLDDLRLDEPVRTLTYNAMQRYERLVRAGDAADFGDLLILAVKLLRKAKMKAPSSRPAVAQARGGGPSRATGRGGGSRLVARKAKAKADTPAEPEPQTSLPLSTFAEGLAGMIDFTSPAGGVAAGESASAAGASAEALPVPQAPEGGGAAPSSRTSPRPRPTTSTRSPASAAASPTSSSTSFRTPTRSRPSSSTCSRPSRSSASSATTTRRSTAGAAPMSGRSSPSPSSTRRARSSPSIRTTGAPPTSSTAPTRSSAATTAASARRCTASSGRGSLSGC